MDVAHWFVDYCFKASSLVFWPSPSWFFWSPKWPYLDERVELWRSTNDVFRLNSKVGISEFSSWKFRREHPLKSDFRLRKSGEPHQPRPQNPIWLLRASTYVKAVVMYCLLALICVSLHTVGLLQSMCLSDATESSRIEWNPEFLNQSSIKSEYWYQYPALYITVS